MSSWDRRIAAASRSRELLDPQARRRRLRQLGLPAGLHPDDEVAAIALLRLAESRTDGFSATLLGRVRDETDRPDAPAGDPRGVGSAGGRTVRIGIVGHGGGADVVVHDADRTDHDHVTGLPTRHWALDRIGDALAGAGADTGVGVYVIDVDRFKSVNDAAGYAAGDEVLRRLAGRLREAIRIHDHLAHLGGDDFVVVSPDVRGPAEAQSVAERLRTITADADGDELPGGLRLSDLTVSVGVALGNADEAAGTLLAQAETALHQAKTLGRDRVAFFDRALRARTERRLTVDQRLRRALDDDAIEVRYQPIVELATERITAVEALLRIEGDDGAPLDPRETVAAAEDSGLIRRVEESVLERAARTVRALPDTDDPVTLSVNVSERRLADSRFPLVLARLLHLADLPADQVRLEIGVSILAHLPSPRRLASQLRALGVSVALDGAETLPDRDLVGLETIDEVKLSRRLVQGVHDERVRRHLELLVTDLRQRGVAVVAVGVETAEDRDAVAELGVTHGQGYFWSPPVPGRQLAEILASGGPVRTAGVL